MRAIGSEPVRLGTGLLFSSFALSFALALALAGAGPATAQPVFTDVTVAAGVDYLQYQLESPPAASEPVYMSGGAAAGDYDGDGWTDLFVTRLDAPDLLFRNQGDGTFEEVSAAAGLTADLPSNGAAWVDVDNDGDLDLYVTTIHHTRYYLYINTGGVFTEEGVARGAALEGVDEHFGYGIAVGDFDLDGWLDLFVGEWRHDSYNPGAAPSNARLLRNQGPAQPGHFADVTAAAGVTLDAIPGTQPGTFPFTPRFADMDADGWPELVIAADFGESRIFWNDGDGTFTDGTAAAGVGTDENGMGSAIGDFDGDGLLDWFVTSIFDPDEQCETSGCGWGYSGNRLFRNEGNRTFSDQTDTAGVRDGFWGWGAAFLDYDNDGDLDVAMTNGVDFAFLPPPGNLVFDRFDDDPLCLWRNDGPGAWTEVAGATGFVDTRSGKGFLTFDYDRDGDVDVFVANNAEHPLLLRNDGGNASDWLRVRVVDPLGGRDAIGAVVEVTSEPGGPTLVREVSGGGHFLGQSEFPVHVGLGDLAQPLVHEVKVTWPRLGVTRRLLAVPANLELVVVVPGRCGLLGAELLPLVWLAIGRRSRKRRR